MNAAEAHQVRAFMRLSPILAAVFLIWVSQAFAAAPEREVHRLRVSGTVSYRCYGGYDAKQRPTDERTGAPCDNQTTKATLIDEVKSIELKDEPDPENVHSLEGSWLQTFDFKGRKFTIALSLFKDFGPEHYRLRVVARDDEPQARATAVFVETRRLAELNPVTVEFSSAGKKEEISFVVTVRHAGAAGMDGGH